MLLWEDHHSAFRCGHEVSDQVVNLDFPHLIPFANRHRARPRADESVAHRFEMVDLQGLSETNVMRGVDS